MKTPESVRYDPDLDVFFVSNINGNPSQHDGNGFIAVVRADSTGVVKMLVEGGKNGVTLDAPKGLAIVGDTLWVADINHVRAFNKRTGAKIADIDLSSQHAIVSERRRRRRRRRGLRDRQRHPVRREGCDDAPGHRSDLQDRGSQGDRDQGRFAELSERHHVGRRERAVPSRAVQRELGADVEARRQGDRPLW